MKLHSIYSLNKSIKLPEVGFYMMTQEYAWMPKNTYSSMVDGTVRNVFHASDKYNSLKLFYEIT